MNDALSIAEFRALQQQLSTRERVRQQRLEEKEQMALMDWCDTVRLRNGRCLREYVAAVPNGGWRTTMEAGRFKAAGVLTGFPDLECFIAAGEYTGLHIEMKYGRNAVSQVQRDVHALLREQRRKVVTCWSWVAAAAELRKYIGLDAAQWPMMEYGQAPQ